MAVYTHLERSDFEELLAQYDIGALKSFEGIRQGVENTNYHLFTDKGRYILTVFEKRVKESDLPFYFAFTSHLTRNGIICPDAVRAQDGAILKKTHGKSCAIINFLEGHGVEPTDITPRMCGQLGALVARMHEAGTEFEMYRKNDLSVAGWKALADKINARSEEVQAELQNEIARELKYLSDSWPANMPVGVVHADIFPDNVFAKDGNIYGVIDFYFSCSDFLVYDLALVVNAWCFDDRHNFVFERWEELLKGYESVRPLTDQEKKNFAVIARGAAMRIMMTRLHDWVFHDKAALVTPKDPKEYLAKVRFHRDNTLFT